MGKRIIALLLLVFTLLASSVVSFADSSVIATPLDTTSIEKDFESASFDTDKFISNLKDKNEVQICIVREYIQRFKVSSAKRWLYIYVYAPYVENGEQVVFESAYFYLGQNLDAGGNPSSYETPKGTVIDVTDCGRFYKFKVDVTSIVSFKDYKRIYVIDGVTLGCGDTVLNAVNFKDHKRFLFEGSDDTGNLNVEYMYDYVIDLDTVLKHYRTESSSKGDAWRNDVFYVYFSIPNEFLQKYDSLIAVEYKYWEEMFNGFACSDDKVYEYAKKLILYDGELPKTLSGYFDTLPSLYINDYKTGTQHDGDYTKHSDYAINPGFMDYVIGEYLTELSNVVQVEDWTEDDILFFDFNLENKLSYAQDGCTYGWNRVTTKVDESITVKSLFGNESDFVKWFLKHFDGYSDEVVNDVDITNKCIEKIDESFFNDFENASSWSKHNFIEVKDMEGVRYFYNEATANDRTMYIMRLPKTRDYYAAKTILCTSDYNNWMQFDNGFYFQGTSITDFNIISFTFQDEGISYKVLVNDDVQDFEVPIEGPIDTDFDNFNEGVSKWWNSFTNSQKGVWEGVRNVLKIVATVIILILVVIALYYVVKLIFKIKSEYASFSRKQKSKETGALDVYMSGKFRNKNKHKTKKQINEKNDKEKIENKNEVDKVIIIN